VAIFLSIWLKDIVYNVPPGVIDSPGLCDTDLAKTTLNKNNNKEEQEEEEEEEEEEPIEQGEQGEQ